MVNLPDTIDRTPEYVKFIKDLKQFHDSKGTRLVAEPVLGGCRLDLYKIFRVVVAAGGFDEVTKNRGWKQVGNLFDLRSTCTNSAYILKGVYIRNLLGYEEEKVWNKTWNPPAELLGPHAHRASTLAGKAYRQTERKTRPKIKKPTTNTDTSAIINTIVNNHVTEKDRILFALQFGRESDVEWALNMIVQKSFECPEKIELNQTPLLLDIFISMAETGLMHLATAYHAERLNSNILDIMSNDHGHHSNNGELGTVLKVLHILRNLSSVKEYTQILAHNRSVNNVILQSLEVAIMMGHVEIGRHSIDILENIAPNIHLVSKEDPFLVSLYKLVSSHDRYLVIGSIRTLSWLSVQPTNHTCLVNSPVLEPIIQLLMADDEELVGTVVEYTLQYAKMSSESRSEVLKICNHGVYAMLIALLLTKSKYFSARFVQQESNTLLPNATKSASNQGQSKVIPRVPDLTIYHNLDEPYRCLGWLKDKFEVAERTSVVSLDDIYLLYEARFGLEKALKMKDFYTVIKIAFTPALSPQSVQQTPYPSPTIEGLDVCGIQMKTSILQDRPQVACQWNGCLRLFTDTFTLQTHVLCHHMVSTEEEKEYYCQWASCQGYALTREAFISHLQSHFFTNDYSQCTSPELSSSPSTPSSSSSVETMDHVDSNESQGVALVVCHLLDLLSNDPDGAQHLKSFDKELNSVAESRPKLASRVWAIRSRY